MCIGNELLTLLTTHKILSFQGWIYLGWIFFFFTEATILSLVSFVFTRVLILPSLLSQSSSFDKLGFLIEEKRWLQRARFFLQKGKKKKNDTVSLLLFLFFKHILRLYTLIHTSGVSSRVSLYSIC